MAVGFVFNNRLKIVKLNKNRNMRGGNIERGREKREERAGESSREAKEHIKGPGLFRNKKVGKGIEAQPLDWRGLG